MEASRCASHLVRPDATVARAGKPAALTWLLNLTIAPCIRVFSSELGTYARPSFVESVFGGTGRIGTETGLNLASSADSSEDFINPDDDVSDYYDMGLVSAAVNRHYGTLRASQLDYALLGIASGLCASASPPTRSRERH
ncbi:MAG: hypothetical protein WAN22_26680 [Solirubrobacteraceae bacterium]